MKNDTKNVSKMFMIIAVVYVTCLLLSNLIDNAIKFFDDPTLAKITVILVNMWIGIPHTMLMSSGILSAICSVNFPIPSCFPN